MSRPEWAEPINVFLDTEVFDAVGHDYATSRFRHLARLVGGSQVRVVLTDAACGEIREHAKEKAESAYAELIKLSKRTNTAVLKNLPSVPLAALTGVGRETVVVEALAALDRLLAGWSVEYVPLKEVGVESVVEDYFARRPPFSEKKKDEFFDSFTAKALINWCSVHK